MSVTSIRVRLAAPHYRRPGSILQRLVAAATASTVEIVTNRTREVDINFVSVHEPAVQRLASMAARQAVRKGIMTTERWREASHHLMIGSTRNRATIWFTGENVRPPSDGRIFGSLSFDVDGSLGRNVYFPIWFETLNVLGGSAANFAGIPLSIEGAMSARSANRTGRELFMCTFIGNMTPMRGHVIAAMSQLGRVDVFGRASGRSTPSKAEIASRYRFVLCMENDLYPGYVTEKPFEAWATGAIPVWWGLDPSGYIRGDAVVDIASHESLESAVSQVEFLDSHVSEWEAVASLPVLQRQPDLAPALDLVRSALEQSHLGQDTESR